MCGITGVLTLETNEPGSRLSHPRETVKAMTETLRHRGPDGLGIYSFGGTGKSPSLHLGHTRLKVIDLTERGHQPMLSEDGRYGIVYNGEVYNYIELREELRQAGHSFVSETDTEVVLYAYARWGQACVNRFNGMWAFAIWDREQGSLFLSRDRLGVKPLYYAATPDAFLFASEIKALLASALVPRNPDMNWIYRFVTRGAVDWDERTAFEGVSALLPGHNMTVDASGRVTITAYWDLSGGESWLEENPSGPFRTLLADAVRLRLTRSDVPVGTCLSGGLDSSSIVALACGTQDAPVQTFSAEYADPDCSERYFVDLMERAFPISGKTLLPTSEGFWSILDEITWYLDEPSAAYGIYSQWFVFQEMARHVRVALDGQGGDELLGGYFYYFESYLNDLFNHALSHRDETLLLRFWKELSEAEALTGIQLYERLKRHYYPSRNGHDVLCASFCRDFAFASPAELHFDTPFSEDLNRTLYWTLRRTSLPALLHYEDRMSMAFSVEARLPFLDHRLVEYCLTLPASWKILGTTTKRVLREAMRDRLPRELVERRDKKGYATPMARWFRNELRLGIEDLFTSASFKSRGILDPEKVVRKFRQHLRGERDYTWEIWRWISLEMWFRRFMDRA
ncbi:MAG: asparagine synthase (glutamine-hydrolyzing) [Deltaproteobacteria bacterium]|nr:asparagine synthase (glutamine-hydrolyzing) [Deltaproteobacteria bacterium]